MHLLINMLTCFPWWRIYENHTKAAMWFLLLVHVMIMLQFPFLPPQHITSNLVNLQYLGAYSFWIYLFLNICITTNGSFTVFEIGSLLDYWNYGHKWHSSNFWRHGRSKTTNCRCLGFFFFLKLLYLSLGAYL